MPVDGLRDSHRSHGERSEAIQSCDAVESPEKGRVSGLWIATSLRSSR